jgi:two-component system sensor histidine kinase BaeS
VTRDPPGHVSSFGDNTDRPREKSNVALPISVRLFLVVFASMALAGLVGLGLVRWRLGDDPTPMAAEEAQQVQALVDDLSARYAVHGDWRFLPADPDARAAWLRARVAAAARSRTPTDDSTLGARLALRDAGGHRIAGSEPAAVLVALASVDRRRWSIPSVHGTAGYVSVAVPRNADDALTIAFLVRNQRSLALLAACAFALSALAAAFAAASFRRPIAALVEGARRLGAGQLDTRIALRRRDELGELARAFDDLGARLDAASRSRRAWIADTSHEMRTPLAVLRAQIEAMQDGVRPLSHGGLSAMTAQLASMQALVDDLDQLARGDVGALLPELVPVDFWSVLRSTWDAFGERLRERGLQAEVSGAPAHARGLGDASRIAQVLRNLLENSARYTAPGGRVTLSGHVEGTQLHVFVDDSAPGVPTAALARLGERFFRVDASRSRAHGGSGLGLALSRQIVEAHGGRLEFAPSMLGGLRAHVILPLEPA